MIERIQTIYSFVYEQLKYWQLDRFLTDKFFLKLMFRAKVGRKLNLKNPYYWDDKVQWLKLYDGCEKYSHLVDKVSVKQYVSEIIGKEYIIPTLDVWDKYEDIEFDKLPNRFVLKCNHNSGSVVVCKDKKLFDFEAAKEQLNEALKENYYWSLREKQYKNIVPCILAEEYMVDESGNELKDYKFFCFDGEPKIIMVTYNRFRDLKINFYDLEWNYQPVSIGYPTDPNVVIEKPDKLEEMINIARKLSKGYVHVRVDLYSTKERIYFGELTFHSGSGAYRFEPESFERQMGEWIKLPIEKK